ncbi:N-acetylmuramoyl-L-alanine amidase [Sporosarcina sp. GW1-11]|uniref:N-acetylmuramoyl-L-alanine amidase family protein n=1 Tax=Sporosarcina sp. GW1-11 TaxID=2899126 RepID=UPI00294F2A91|nr:N-acetylmuramoyl-L-alanine amidase [Sporosarcina sp. GW1-11]MDV6378914.1 N-acetylmuramoyl-L-alanine amidase [Sporosarcina sp. GW1-11]
MVRIALDAGHGLFTAGKRSPIGEREWFFNNQVLLACVERLKEYENVSLLRLDDASGKIDQPLENRTDRANQWKADVLISFHHNANTGKWGNWGGVETFVYPTASKTSFQLAELIHPKVVQAMGLRDRGIKKRNLHMLRESNMPAILIEGGFYDSLTDIQALRSSNRLIAQGVAVADGLAAYFKLKKKTVEIGNVGAANQTTTEYRLVTGTFKTKVAAEKAADLLRKKYGWTIYIKDA